jgi:MFS family permease
VPRRPFYGWYIVGICMLGAFLSSGTSQLFMSVMVQPMSEDLGWSRTAITGAIMIGSIAAGLLAPPIGFLADRYGPRRLTTVGALVMGGAYLLLANLSELWQLYLVYVVGRAIAASTVASVVPMTAATNWFRRMRGRALGLIAMSTPLGSAILALVAEALIEGPGWRAVFVAFGVGSLALVVVPAAVVLRRRPEDLGLLPDGASSPPAGAPAPSPSAPVGEVPWTLGGAMRTPALWLLIASSIIAAMANTAVGFHQVAYFTNVGLAPAEAVLALSVYALAGALASGLWGWLTERFSERTMAVVATLISAGVIVYILFVRSLAGALVFAVLFGLTSRGGSTLVNIILAHYYGRHAYGAISGFVYPFAMVGLGAGPFLGSVSYDLAGSYDAVFLTFAAASVLVAALLWLARKPVPPARLSRERAALL